MRPFRALAVFVGLAVAGCAGTNGTPAPSLANQASQSVAGRAGSTGLTRVKHDNASYKRALYVLNSASNEVQILTNTYYRQLGTITDGISNPQAETVDNRGNLYVANQTGSNGDVAEYATGATSPSFTYSATAPLGVAVDRHGNVFAVAGYPSYTVNQYRQGVNRVVASCQINRPKAVAVDANGNVFVEGITDFGITLFEFVGGLGNCSPTLLLGIGYNYSTFGLTLDANGDLIAPYGPNVYVIDPPYSTITKTIGSGFSNVSGVSLNKKNKFLFVSDSGTNTITVINYQTGATVQQLGVPYGITQASGVVDAPNAVY
jgi:hypothetical protein